MPNLPARQDVPVEETWNLESIFTTKEAWEAAFQEVEQLAPELKKRFEGRLGESPKILQTWLEELQTAEQKLLKVIQYAQLNYSVDTTNPESAAMAGRSGGLASRATAALAFEEPEVMAIGFEKIKSWMEEYPGLKSYAHYFAKLERKAAHIRSQEVEALFSQVADPFHTAAQTHGILVNADVQFKPAVDSQGIKHEVTHSKMRELNGSTDRKLRRNGWKSYAEGHLAYKHTMANSLTAGYKQDAFFAQARGYQTSVEATLDNATLPVEVFHNVIKAFKANVPVWHRYWELRRKVMGLNKLHVYDTYAALSDTQVDIPFTQAVEWICEGLAPMGGEYVKTVRQGATVQRWVDRAMNKGKRFGAFSYGVKGSQPFIMMSYDNSIYSMSTLAHELGHSMHSYYTGQTQPWIYSHYGLFAAEVASNFHQALVRDYMLKTKPDRAIRLAVLEEAMSNFYRYFFTMPMLAQFDLEFHTRIERGESPTAEDMNKVMARNLQMGYGKGVIVDEERDGCLWSQFSTHLYSNFYNYQYTTGIAGAHSLAAGVLKGKPGAVDNYQSFLKAGGSLYPLDALKLAGVDLSTPEPVHQAFRDLDGYITQLEELLLG